MRPVQANPDGMSDQEGELVSAQLHLEDMKKDAARKTTELETCDEKSPDLEVTCRGTTVV